MLSFRFFPVVHHLKTAHQNVRNKLSNGNKICPRQKNCSGVVYLEIDDSDPPKKNNTHPLHGGKEHLDERFQLMGIFYCH